VQHVFTAFTASCEELSQEHIRPYYDSTQECQWWNRVCFQQLAAQYQTAGEQHVKGARGAGVPNATKDNSQLLVLMKVCICSLGS